MMTAAECDVSELLEELEIKLKQAITERKITDPLMIGIRSGGVWVAEILHRRLAIQQPLGFT